ncbi:MAG: hypothetical protein J6X33_02075 [Clostridiales bacterium]|nr:hypothetical protein [Clostridiales bacterium]
MSTKERYNDIAVFEVEIISFTDEGYRVKYDFRRKVLSWRDNYMWNNNFTILINDDKFNLLKEKLPKLGVIEWMEAYNEGDTEKYGMKVDAHGSWKMKIEFTDKTVIKSGCEQNFPRKWEELRSLIEMTTGTTFALR